MERFFIAQLGKTVGLWGDLKLHLHTDFPEQFKIGQTFQSDRGPLEIVDINMDRGIVRFRGYESLESAKKLTNAKLYTTKEETRKRCELDEGEHFWFEVIGCRVMEEGEGLGKVSEIQRILDTDYLVVQTEDKLEKEGLSSSFLIPYIPRYVIRTDTQTQQILTKDAKDILEAS